jgi:2-keto-4-pentenoate hydratase/2-oxohepta-3-ene-1,7-dioic acid hydratase in catechol pathway
MRIARVATDAGARVALVEGEALRLMTETTDVLDLLRDRGRAEPTAATLALDAARLLPPLDPPSIRDFLTFEQHVEGMVRLHEPPRDVHPRWYEAPTFYFSNPHSLVGAHDDVPIPPGCVVFDYELEVAAVIGRDGRDLTPADARDHIVAYTIFNDWSARDLQRDETTVRLGPAKGKDFASSFGPWLVTPDELADARDGTGYDLAMTATVNGRETSRGRWADAQHSFGAMLARASADARLRPGDLVGSGTVGTGCLLEVRDATLGRYLEPGDQVVLRVERLGALRTPVVARPA